MLISAGLTSKNAEGGGTMPDLTYPSVFNSFLFGIDASSSCFVQERASPWSADALGITSNGS
ncbi:hypothetical protein ACKS0A_07973 [Histoplasma ohiense]